jgi:hypothetical protein
MFCGAMSEFRLEERAVDFHASVMYLAEQKSDAVDVPSAIRIKRDNWVCSGSLMETFGAA